MFWALRASRTLSLAEGLRLAQGAEEQERRARSRAQVRSIARLPEALLGSSPDPSGFGPCLRGPSRLSSAPQFRAAALLAGVAKPRGGSLPRQGAPAVPRASPPLPSP